MTSSRRSRTAAGVGRVRCELDAGHAADLADQLAGPDERLRGHAGVERALAADQVPLAQGDVEVRLGKAAGGDLARRAGTDHDDVEVLFHTSQCPRDGRAVTQTSLKSRSRNVSDIPNASSAARPR